MPGDYLTREDIVEVTGEERLEEVEDLEVLFLTFKAIANLQHCPSLRRLCLIDNGLEKIDNLLPIASTLKILCICDQAITSVESLDLPNLRELYLHRNAIDRLATLSSCPRLRKLWLFQNHLTSILPLQGLAELEECWLQCNAISHLPTMLHLPALRVLHLAGNPLVSLEETRPLITLRLLSHLSFQDIHFGRCDLVDEKGYRSYLVLLLKQLLVLDGVPIRGRQRQQPQQQQQQRSLMGEGEEEQEQEVFIAQQEYYQEMESYAANLQEIEDSYQKSLRAIDMQHQSRESYSAVLEKEMTAALRELQGLVTEGRQAISQEIQGLEHLLDSNLITFQDALDRLTSSLTRKIQSHLHTSSEHYRESLHLLYLLETLARYNADILRILAQTATTYRLQQEQQQKMKKTNQGGGRGGDDGNDDNAEMAYSVVNPSSADFLFIAALLEDASSTTTTTNGDGGEGSSTPGNHHKTSKKGSGSGSVGSATAGDVVGGGGSATVTYPLELAKLYKVVFPRKINTSKRNGNNSNNSSTTTSNSSGSSGSSGTMLYLVLRCADLETVFTKGWQALGEGVVGIQQSVLVSEDPVLIANLCLSRLDPLPDSYAKATTSSGGEEEVVGRPVLLLGVELLESVGRFPTASQARTLSLPTSDSQRTALCTALCSSSEVQAVHFSNYPSLPPRSSSGSNGNSSNTPTSTSTSSCHLLALPLALCEKALAVDHLALAMLHFPLNGTVSGTATGKKRERLGGLVKGLEGRLEVLLLPSHHLHQPHHLAQVFESEASALVDSLLSRLLEEVDAEQAQILRRREHDVQQREQALRVVREEIEGERRQQEGQLRDLRGATISSASSSSANTGRSQGNAVSGRR